MTAYRQQALDCARALAAAAGRPRDLKPTMPDAPKILQRNVYGWFERSSAAAMASPRLAAPRLRAGRPNKRANFALGCAVA